MFNALSAWIFAVDRALNSYFMIMIICVVGGDWDGVGMHRRDPAGCVYHHVCEWWPAAGAATQDQTTSKVSQRVPWHEGSSL